MDVDETPAKATFTSKNYGLAGENTKVQPRQYDEHNLHVSRAKSPHPLHGDSDSKPKIPSSPSKMDIDENSPKATFTLENYGLPGGSTKVQPGQHVEQYIHVSRTTSSRPLHGNPHIQTQDSLNNVSAPTMVVDTTETTLQPEPRDPNYLTYRPISCESQSQQEGHLNSSNMNID